MSTATPTEIDYLSTTHPSLDSLPNGVNLNSTVRTVLTDEFDSLSDILALSDAALAQRLNDHLAAEADPVDLATELPTVTTQIGEKLQEYGITTAFGLARADVDDLCGYDDALERNRSRLRQAQAKAKEQTLIADASLAAQVKQAVEVAYPTHRKAAAEIIHRWNTADQHGATVTKVQDKPPVTSVPRILDCSSYDACNSGPSNLYYVSNTGVNADDPQVTGLPVLGNNSYEEIPTPGEDLPADDDGTPVKPAPATGRIKDVQVDEYIARKLARGEPVFAIGHRGVGKDYRFKYIAWKTNRGHRQIDCNNEMQIEDLFGTLSPNEDGIVVVRDGELKQGLLNPDINVLSEFPALSAGTAMKLHGLLAENKIRIDYQGELVEPHQGACIAATGNPDTIEYKGSEDPDGATKGRFNSIWVTAPDEKDGEIQAIDAQVNTSPPGIDDYLAVHEQTLNRVVEFARRTRDNDDWPTLSPRNVVQICEDIEDSVSPANAIRGKLNWIAGRHMESGKDEAVSAISDVFDN